MTSSTTMIFTHDTTASLLTAVALVNSASAPDTLMTVEDLDAFLSAHRYTTALRCDAEVLASVRALREPLRMLLTCTRDAAADLVNTTLATHSAVPRLVRHDAEDWHMHAVANDAPLAVQIDVETAMAMVEIIQSDEMSRLSKCDYQSCDGLVLDLSRNRSRRFCSVACGNRIAVAAYRQRRRGGSRSDT